MSLTRANVEAELIVRAGTLLTTVGLDGTTKDGTNASLNGAIRRGLLALGLTTTDAVQVADVDLGPVSGWDLEKLLDAAELRTLESIWGNWAHVKQTISLGTQELQQLADRIERRIESLEERLRKPYGPNVQRPVQACGAHKRIPADRIVTPPAGFAYGYGDEQPIGSPGFYP